MRPKLLLKIFNKIDSWQSQKQNQKSIVNQFLYHIPPAVPHENSRYKILI